MNKKYIPFGLALPLLLAVLFSNCKKDKDSSDKNFSSGLNKVNHVVVIYLENHSFDNLYGQFQGANGLSNAKDENIVQDSLGDTPYTFLPMFVALADNGQFPAMLPNKLFNIDQYVAQDLLIPDVTHRYYQEQMQINGGKMNKYALYNAADKSSAGLSQGYYTTANLPMNSMATKYTLCDNFFHSAFGGSFLNHQWLIAAASPTFPNAPASMVAKLDASGNPIVDVAKDGTIKISGDGKVTPDGFVVNTTYTVNAPHPSNAKAEELVPNQKNPTIGDKLSEKKISWAWYAGGWNDALAGKPDVNFQFHHQPFAFYANYADGTQAKKEHLKDEKDFIDSAKKGSLPAVSFVKPIGADNEHPGYATLKAGEDHTMELINDVLNGPNGKDAVIIVTYDENGGFWDHVAPPKIDKWGPGTRVPAIIISPFAKKGFVDHNQYETVSILSFIEKRWDLSPLNDRDKKADPLSNAFQF